MIGNDELVAPQAFTYLGSIITNDGKCDMDIEHRIGKANQSFGRLRCRVWISHEIRLETKLALYNAIVLSLLLYGCEVWTLYARHVKQINSFHLRCLRSIMGIKWSDYITNDEVCARAGSSEMRIILTRRKLRWAGHVVRMDEGRLPKQVLYGELASGTRARGRPKIRFKDTLKSNISSCGLPKWETAATNRSKWQTSVFEGTKVWKEVRVAERREARLRRKEPT